MWQPLDEGQGEHRGWWCIKLLQPDLAEHWSPYSWLFAECV